MLGSTGSDIVLCRINGFEVAKRIGSRATDQAVRLIAIAGSRAASDSRIPASLQARDQLASEGSIRHSLP